MNGRLLGVVACLMGSAWSPPALASGDIGHRIIFEIAFYELTEATRQRVKALRLRIGAQPDVSASAWAGELAVPEGSGG